MDKKSFQSQVSFKLEVFSKLNWLFYYLLWLTIQFSIHLNVDDKSGIRKSGSISH